MSTEEHDGWWQSMNDLQADLIKRQNAEIVRLRKENAALKKHISETPSYLSELQDRVTLLECQRKPSP